MSVGVGVIGLGFMGRTHLRAYRDAGAHVVAVCDRSPERLRGRADGVGGNLGARDDGALFDPSEVHATDDPDAMLATPGLSLVSVCTPTDTHVGAALRAMRAGKHVLVEKPVALDAASVRTLAAESRRLGVLCMPAMCMRFWPAWAWAARCAQDGSMGRVRALRLERIGAPPAWGGGFYADPSRSGGALFDLHVHDTDFVVHALGVPASVRTAGDVSHMTTVYGYRGGPLQVVASGGWLRSPAVPFRMRMVMELDGGVIDFDLGREPALRVFDAGGEAPAPALDGRDGWAAEVAAMVGAVAAGATEPPATMESAVRTTAVLEAERESLERGSDVAVRG